MIEKKELQIKTEEDGNFKAKKYSIEIAVNILNTTRGDVYGYVCAYPAFHMLLLLYTVFRKKHPLIFLIITPAFLGRFLYFLCHWNQE